MIAGLVSALALLAALPLTRPLGPLAGTMTLVLVLPPLARALVGLGWADRLSGLLGRARGRAGGLIPFGLWLVVSALLTLDVAAVLAAPVGLRLGAGSGRSRREQLMAAIVGANGGSLLFPFSNLTNLLVVSGTGLAFGTYVAQAVLPQLAIVSVAAVLLVRRQGRDRRSRGRVAVDPRASARAPSFARAASDDGSAGLGPEDPGSLDTSAWVAGLVAVLGALAAVAVGLRGGDVALPFAFVAAIVAGLAVATGHESPLSLARAVPLSGVVVVLAAAVALGPTGTLAAQLGETAGSAQGATGDLVACLIGGLLAAGLNNLPAAAFGAAWLRGDPAAVIVAYLVGTNIVSLVTPPGSLATILARSSAARAGQPLAAATYCRAAWRYALLPAGAALLVITLGG